MNIDYDYDNITKGQLKQMFGDFVHSKLSKEEYEEYTYLEADIDGLVFDFMVEFNNEGLGLKKE